MVIKKYILNLYHKLINQTKLNIMKSKNNIQNIKTYLRKNTISETFLYNNRLFLNHYITADIYENNRMFILRYRSLAMNNQL